MNHVEEKVDIAGNAKVSHSTLRRYARIKEYGELYHSELGEYSYISQFSIVNKAKIGKFSSVAQGCYIGLWEHNTAVSTHSFYLYEHSGEFVSGYKNYDRDVEETLLGSDVWVGANVSILKGVCVGDGAIIGAGAVVTKDVPAYAVAVGNPARVIKYRYSEDEIRWLTQLRWWDLSREKIQELVDKKAFEDFDLFKQLLGYPSHD